MHVWILAPKAGHRYWRQTAESLKKADVLSTYELLEKPQDAQGLELESAAGIWWVDGANDDFFASQMQAFSEHTDRPSAAVIAVKDGPRWDALSQAAGVGGWMARRGLSAHPERAVSALTEASAAYAAVRLMEASRWLVAIVDQAGRVCRINPTGATLLGGDAAASCGKLWKKLRSQSALAHFRPTAPGLPIVWQGKPCTLISLQNPREVQERNELQQRLEATDTLASVGHLAAGVAHEINNPAAFVTLNTEVVRTMLRDVGQQLQSPTSLEGEGLGAIWGCLDDIQSMLDDNLEGMQRISSVVRDLRSFTQGQSQKTEWVNVNDLVSVACNVAFHELKHHGRLITDLSHVPCIVADRVRLCHALVKLLLRSVYAMDRDRNGEDELLLSTRFVEDTVIITVEDTGAPLSEEQKAAIFDRMNFSGPWESAGGMGLWVVAETLREHRGHVCVTSGSRGGSRFDICLPRDTGKLPHQLPDLKSLLVGEGSAGADAEASV